MAEKTGIEWTHHTFNPWSGCVKVSPGCANCYASNLPPSMRRNAIWGKDAQRIPASEAYWNQPYTWDRAAAKAGERRRVFCASVADVFEDRDDLADWRIRLFEMIEQTPHLDWLLLTKRPEQIMRRSIWSMNPWPTNVWVGTSVENQEAADERIPHLLRIPARVRFLSMEPLLGAVDLGGASGIHWVIVGGESGRRARPMHPEWARSVRDQCKESGVPFFFKQHGEWRAYTRDDFATPGGMLLAESTHQANGTPSHLWRDNAVSYRIGKKAAGRDLGRIEHSAFPEVAGA